MTGWTTRRFVVCTRSGSLKQCAPVFGVLARFRVTRYLLLHFVHALYKVGVFFLELFIPLFELLEASFDQADMVAQNSGGLGVAKGSDQASERDE